MIQNNRAVCVDRRRAVQSDRIAHHAFVRPTGLGGRGGIGRSSYGDGRGVGILCAIVVRDLQADCVSADGHGAEVGSDAGGVVILSVAVQIPLIQNDRTVCIGRRRAVQSDRIAFHAFVRPTGLGGRGGIGRSSYGDGRGVGILCAIVVGDLQADCVSADGHGAKVGSDAGGVIKLSVAV